MTDQHQPAQPERYLNVSIETVRRLRYKGRGPRYRRISSQIRYCLADVRAWCEAQPGGGVASPNRGPRA